MEVEQYKLGYLLSSLYSPPLFWGGFHKERGEGILHGKTCCVEKNEPEVLSALSADGPGVKAGLAIGCRKHTM